MIVEIDFSNVYRIFQEQIEVHYPYGCYINEHSFWEVVDECFVDKIFQDYKSLDLYEGFSYNILTEAATGVFSDLMENVNVTLDYYYKDGNRFMIPETVYYLGQCRFRIVH